MSRTNHTQVEVTHIPPCDFCKEDGEDRPAEYNARTVSGYWAYLCLAHYRGYGVGLGLGKGQKLILKKKGEDSD